MQIHVLYRAQLHSFTTPWRWASLTKTHNLNCFILFPICLKQGRECWKNLGESDPCFGKALCAPGSPRVTLLPAQLCSADTGLYQYPVNSPLASPRQLCVRCWRKLLSAQCVDVRCQHPVGTGAKVCRDPAGGLSETSLSSRAGVLQSATENPHTFL